MHLFQRSKGTLLLCATPHICALNFFSNLNSQTPFVHKLFATQYRTRPLSHLSEKSTSNDNVGVTATGGGEEEVEQGVKRWACSERLRGVCRSPIQKHVAERRHWEKQKKSPKKNYLNKKKGRKRASDAPQGTVKDPTKWWRPIPSDNGSDSPEKHDQLRLGSNLQ